MTSHLNGGGLSTKGMSGFSLFRVGVNAKFVAWLNFWVKASVPKLCVSHMCISQTAVQAQMTRLNLN